MRWFLLFLLILFEILLVFLVIPVGIKLEASNEALDVYAKIAGINIKVFPKDKKKKTGEKEKHPKKQSDSEKTIEKAREKAKLSFEKIMEYMDFASEAISWAVSGIYIRHFFLRAGLHNDDAAKTAIIYGSTCSALGIIIPRLEKIFKVKNSRIEIYPNFDGINEFNLKMTVMAVPIQLIFIGSVLYIKWNKLKKKDKAVQK